MYIYIYIYTDQQEKTNAEVRPQQSRRAALLKSLANAGAAPQIHRTNSQKHPLTRAPQRTAPAHI